MNIQASEAYTNGRIAGAKHYFVVQRDARAKPPTCPYEAKAFMARIEWDRGFSDGLQMSKKVSVYVQNYSSFLSPEAICQK